MDSSSPPHNTDSTYPGERSLIDDAWNQAAGLSGSKARGAAGNRAIFGVQGYRILGEIHRGGQGVVYQAMQESTQRKVAIKVLKHGPFADQTELARFDREVDILSRINHPHIVAVRDRGLSAGHAYYVMDYIPGRALDAHAAAAELTVEEMLALFVKVCNAVNVAHLRGIIHRDLKPGNIRVDEGGEPRILDFGLARTAEDGSSVQNPLGEMNQLTLTGQFVGSLPWASPEQAGAQMDLLDIRTDVYSLGVVLYHLLTQRFPYPVTGRIDEVIAHIARTNPVRPSEIVAGLDHDLELIALKCLEKEPERRYQSAGELARDIRHFLASEPVTATSPSAIYRMRKFVKRNRGLVLAGGLISAVLLLGTVGTTIGMVWALREQERTQEQARIAQENAERASQQAARADRQAQQTQTVANFQAEMLSDIDPQAMGLKIRAQLLAKARAAAKLGNHSRAEVDAHLQELEKLIAGIDLTGLALATLNENVFERSFDAIDAQFADQPLLKARLLQTLASALVELGLFDAATRPQLEALEIRRRVQGADDPDTLASLNSAAGLMLRQGKLEQAGQYYREVLEKRRTVLGDEHPQTLASLHDFARLLAEQGQFDESERYYRETLEKQRRVLGEESRETIASLEDLGTLLEQCGKRTEAETVLREAADKFKRALGGENRETLAAINNLGTLLFGLGKTAEAEKLWREALQGLRRVLGDDHPDTINVVHNLGFFLQSKGQFAEAEPFCRESLENNRRVLGAEHPQTINALNSLARLLFSLGKFDETETLLREALASSRRSLGEDHPDTMGTMNNLATLLFGQGNFQDAEILFRQILEKRRNTPGSNPSDTMLTINNLASTLIVLGKIEEADPLYREAFENNVAKLGRDHPETLTSICNMGVLLKEQGKPAEAEKYYREAYEKRRSVLGKTHPSTLTATYGLGSALQMQGKSKDAIALLEPIESAARRAFTGGNAIRLGRFLLVLGEARGSAGAFESATANLSEAQSIILDCKGATQRERTALITAMVKFYEAWERAKPGQGHDAEADEWRARQKPSQ